MAALNAANMKTSIITLLNDNGGQLQLLLDGINDAATNTHIGNNLPLIQQIMPAILARGRAVAGVGSLSYAEAEQQYKDPKNKNNHTIVERYLSPQDTAFDNINSIAGLDAFTALVCAAAAKADGALTRANQIKEECMSHLQTFIYPLQFSKYTATTAGVVTFASTLTYGPATSSVPTNPAITYSATPTPSMVRTTGINNKSMWQYPPNCLYQSQIKMKDGYTESTTCTLAFAMGSDIRGNCWIKTFLKDGGNGVPEREFPFDDDNLGVSDPFSKFTNLYTIYIRRSDSMAIFIDKKSGVPPKRALRTIPPNIVIKLRNTGRRAADVCNNTIGNYVGSMCAAPMKVVTIEDDRQNKVAVVDAAYPLRLLGLPVQNATYFVGDYDVRTINIGIPLTPLDDATLRFLARVAFWRYRASNAGSSGGSNRMMITNGKNGRTKNRNMNKRQRRSKSKSKSMSMFKSAKRTFYRTNKRNKTSRQYH